MIAIYSNQNISILDQGHYKERLSLYKFEIKCSGFSEEDLLAAEVGNYFVEEKGFEILYIFGPVAIGVPAAGVPPLRLAEAHLPRRRDHPGQARGLPIPGRSGLPGCGGASGAVPVPVHLQVPAGPAARHPPAVPGAARTGVRNRPGAPALLRAAALPARAGGARRRGDDRGGTHPGAAGRLLPPGEREALHHQRAGAAARAGAAGR